MFSCRKAAWVAVVLPALAPAGGAAAETYPGIGRAATPSELAAWDIDVRPDLKGLPKGAGSVAQGMAVWESRCASCHGIFGESNEVFSPLVGGTTAQDVQTGRVAKLLDPAYPGRTTLMKLPTVSTLFDYIRRAMPWNEPKSLSVDEVYAVTAYLLNLGGVLPDDFTMSDTNMAEVQRRLPNRHGMRTDHGLWPGAGLGNGGRPDVQAAACMQDCGPAPEVVSSLPAFARNAHGNLAEQNRLVGAQVGADTRQPPGERPSARPRPAPAAAAAPADRPAPTALLQQHSCTACHGMDNKVVGPGFAEVAQKYAARDDRADYLATKIQAGGSGVWGSIPMPAQSLPPADAKAIADWLAGGAAK